MLKFVGLACAFVALSAVIGYTNGGKEEIKWIEEASSSDLDLKNDSESIQESVTFPWNPIIPLLDLEVHIRNLPLIWYPSQWWLHKCESPSIR